MDALPHFCLLRPQHFRKNPPHVLNGQIVSLQYNGIKAKCMTQYPKPHLQPLSN